MNIIPTFPVTELIDRYVIAEIKHEKGFENIAELDFYKHQITIYNINLVKDLMAELKRIHLGIWNLEKELKTGTEQNLPLEEIGRRAIDIRNKNAERVKIKNQIAEVFGCSVREHKRDHLSE